MAGCLPEQRVADAIRLNLIHRQAHLLHQPQRQQLVHPGYHRWPADADRRAMAPSLIQIVRSVPQALVARA